MAYYIQTKYGKIYEGSTVGWGEDPESPDLEVSRIIPESLQVEVIILSDKFGPEGASAMIPITLFDDDAELGEDVEKNNPNAAFRFSRNKL